MSLKRKLQDTELENENELIEETKHDSTVQERALEKVGNQEGEDEEDDDQEEGEENEFSWSNCLVSGDYKLWYLSTLKRTLEGLYNGRSWEMINHLTKIITDYIGEDQWLPIQLIATSADGAVESCFFREDSRVVFKGTGVVEKVSKLENGEYEMLCDNIRIPGSSYDFETLRSCARFADIVDPSFQPSHSSKKKFTSKETSDFIEYHKSMTAISQGDEKKCTYTYVHSALFLSFFLIQSFFIHYLCFFLNDNRLLECECSEEHMAITKGTIVNLLVLIGYFHLPNLSFFSRRIKVV